MKTMLEYENDIIETSSEVFTKNMTQTIYESHVGNAYVIIVNQIDIYIPDDYPELERSVMSMFRMPALYSQENSDLKRAPKGLARKLMCNILRYLIEIKIARLGDYLYIESDDSDDSGLQKMYERMGFEHLSVASEGSEGEIPATNGGLMRGRFDTLLNFCKTLDNRDNKKGMCVIC
jgi:hypothetical protein